MKRIPYGISDFQRLSQEDYYYVDKTRFLERVEAAHPFLFMIRPRRFGKSLWLSLMELYYDIATRDRFDELFGKYYIGQHPTPGRNGYLILKFNFAMVNPDPEVLNDSFESHMSICFDEFNHKYAYLLGKNYLEEYAMKVNAEERLEYIGYRCKLVNQPIYLIIDEYDNFTNVVLSRHGQNRYHVLTHDAGFFRFFFNKIKGITTGAGASVQRMFITGVSPVTLDDVTSGFNIAYHVTMDPRFNEMLGFTEAEVRDMLEYYKGEGCWQGDTDQVLGVMRDWYDNYCFSRSCSDTKMYNSDMVLYCMGYLADHGKMPEIMVDLNVKTDYGKLRQMIILDKHLNGNFSRVKQIAEEGELAVDIQPSFPAEELIKPENFTSLLFYFGILSIDRVEMGETVLKVPNLTIRQILFSYIERGYREAGVFELRVMKLEELMKRMAYLGEWRPAFEYFAEELRVQTSIRDHIEGEKAVQTLHLVYMSMTGHFIIRSEQEMNKGYVDLWMAPNLIRHPEMQYCYVVEFKYLSHGASDESVVEKLSEAKMQLKEYAMDRKMLEQAGTTRVRFIAIVYRAWEMATIEEVE